MDTVAQSHVVVIPPTSQSELVGRSVVLGGFLAAILFLVIASHLNFPWIEKSSPATDFGLAVVASIFATPLILTAWEALDRSPQMIVDHDGVKLHPYFGVPALKWDEIRGAYLREDFGYRGGARSELIIFLATKLRSWKHPFGRDSVMINARTATEAAEALARAAVAINANSSA